MKRTPPLFSPSHYLHLVIVSIICSLVVVAAAAAAAAPMQSPSSAARIGYVLIGVGVMGLLIFVTLIIMWTRERSLHSPKRKYDGQSKRKVAPLEFPESPRVVIVEEEEVDDDGGGDEGTDNGHNQMQIVWRAKEWRCMLHHHFRNNFVQIYNCIMFVK